MSVLKFKVKKYKNTPLKNAFFAFIFAFLSIFSSSALLLASPTPAFADPTTQTQTQTQAQDQTQNPESQTQNPEESSAENTEDVCSSQTGAIGWLVCPTTGFIAKAIDGIYSVARSALVVAPLSSDSSSPIYLVWSYFRSITNIVFIIFILIIILSQLTGVGISNYGIKQALPKIIIAAVLVNLSWIICTLAVDVSNVLGSSLRNVFTDIAEKTITAEAISDAANVSWGSLVSTITGAAAITIGAVLISANVGIFYMLIPLVLGALVAVATGLLTIAMRQAVVSLLIMVSPLAFVCYLLPNTEPWFNRWKGTLTQMLIFYPMFSVLFGASELTGWVLIASAKDAFGIILGLAVQVFPLFFSWSLMKMSNTILGKFNTALNNLAVAPRKAATEYAERKRLLASKRYLGSKAYHLPKKTAQWLNARKERDLNDIKTYDTAIKNRGLAASATYRGALTGKVTRRGAALFSTVSENVKNTEKINRGANDFEKGISDYAKGTLKYNRLRKLDLETRDSADRLSIELARGEMIRRDNAEGRHARFEAALSAHSQLTLDEPGHRYEVDPEDLSRYREIRHIMEGKGEYIHYAGAYAANAHAVQDKIIDGKFANYFDSIPATQEVVNRLKDLTRYKKPNEYIDSVIMGMKTLSMRGDTDLIKHTIDDVLAGDQIKLGTHASQALANFLMFDVKDKDPFLRRYGKFINLETAAYWNEGGKRTNQTLTFNEYIRGEYPEIDPETGKAKRDSDGNIVYQKVKRDSVELMKGTSLNGVERTAYNQMDESIRQAYTDENGNVDTEAMAKRRGEIQNAMLPAFISAGLFYPSGSEQIQSQASFLTGLKLKDGKWVKRWEDPTDSLYGLSPKFFKEQTDAYINAQTSSQILNLRTDLLQPITETLADERISELRTAGELPERFSTLLAAMSDPERYATLSDTDKTDLKNFRTKCAKERFKDLLDKKDQLEQIYKTRRSGAALGTKAAVLEMLDFNNDVEVAKYLKKKSQERQERIEEAERRAREDAGDAEATPPPTYENHNYFLDFFTSLFDESPDDPNFFTRVYNKLRSFGLDVIAYEFRQYHEADPSANNDDLMEFLRDLLEDVNKYV